jgi:hypothetical protein
VRCCTCFRNAVNDFKHLPYNFTFDGSHTDPIQESIRDALLAFMSAIGQAQAEATKLAQQAGIAHAQATEESISDGSPATTVSNSSASSTCWLQIRTSP